MRATSIWMCMGLMLVPSLREGQAHAQISGAIADQIAQRPVPGAVVTVLDSARRVVVRVLADDSGRFRIGKAPGAARVRIVKIGYLPSETAVSPATPVHVALERLPSLLQPVLISDQPKCERNETRPAALGLWEQARAALLGTVVARDSNYAQVRRLRFRRYMSAKGNAIERQSVRSDSGLARRSFDADFPASEFMKRGFAETVEPNGVRFYGPDAEVLLDDALIDGYCLELAEARRDRPNQAGLRFRPMARQKGRVDLDGTLWIDTSARVLSDIEYRYLGLEKWTDRLKPGGVISFRETSPAAVWIDRWTIRMTGAAIDNGQRDVIPRHARQAMIEEGGAELASARWPDGHEWKARLGSAEIRLTTINGAALRDARVQLDSTDYRGATDSTGRLTIGELLPGPYTISVYDSTLAVVDTTLPASIAFAAERDSTSKVTSTVMSLTDFVSTACRDRNAFDGKSAFFVARVLTADSVPMVGARWRLEPAGPDPDVNAPRGYYALGETGSEGRIYVCAGLTRGRGVTLRVWQPDKAGVEQENAAPALLVERVTAIKVVFKP